MAAGSSPASRLASFAAVSPRSSEAMRPGGGGLNSGFGGTGCGGGSGGGGSTTSCTAIGVISGGAAIGHSISNSKGRRCNTSEPIGPVPRRPLALLGGRDALGRIERQGIGGRRDAARWRASARGGPPQAVR